MDTADLIDALDREGTALLATAERAGFHAEVPTCPGWSVRDLVAHTGSVHRWATGYVVGRATTPGPLTHLSVPEDELVDWFRAGLSRLVAGLREADEDLECWTFLPGARTPRAFWARRQAHETAVHRVDAELAAGAELAGVPPGFAADGIDELLAGFHSRERSRVRAEPERVLLVRATDVPDALWSVRIGAAPPRVSRGAPGRGEAPDCEISGPAGTLYLALWNRIPYGDGLVIDGDASVATLWQTTSAIG